VKARSNKNEALLDAMTGALADLTALQLNSRFCRMIAYSAIPKGVVGRSNIGNHDDEALQRQRNKRDAYKKRREAENCAIRKAP
jgi:hypothetical protein